MVRDYAGERSSNGRRIQADLIFGHKLVRYNKRGLTLGTGITRFFTVRPI
jgi:hypothetical protein